MEILSPNNYEKKKKTLDYWSSQNLVVDWLCWHGRRCVAGVAHGGSWWMSWRRWSLRHWLLLSYLLAAGLLGQVTSWHDANSNPNRLLLGLGLLIRSQSDQHSIWPNWPTNLLKLTQNQTRPDSDPTRWLHLLPSRKSWKLLACLVRLKKKYFWASFSRKGQIF